MSDTESEPVPLVDLRAQFRTLGPEMEPALRSVMERGAFIGGTEIGVFEERFANWCGAAHAVGTSSGTTAWHLLLVANEIGPGDEVIIPSHTFIATVEAIWHAGATPVFAEIDPATFCMHPIAAEAMVTPRTKAICPVHLYGRLADMAGFRELCDRCGLLLFEDAAQAHGAIPTTSAQGRGFFPDSRRAGALSDGGVFSFFPGKNLGAYGDAGAVTVDDHEIAQRVRMLANHGRSEKYTHQSLGYNYRMDTIQAAVLGVKLRHMEDWNAARRAAAERYSALLEGVGDLCLPSPDAAEGHVWHLYVVRTKRRDALLSHLNGQGIRAGIHYPIPCHLQPALEGHFQARPGLLQATEEAAGQVLSLPIFPEISEAQQERVARTIREFF